ncbi:hypothetical protein G4O51_09610 [Candidatus Bathyarchaeota archaeon A05DMB-2]|jgi:hypothetical protein|nr:hypothetical protein [Candidatus Bathyarchaeota archaeon A05DMB-2]
MTESKVKVSEVSTYLEPNIQSTSKGGGGRHHRRPIRSVERRIARIAKRHELNTQRVRFELIFELKSLLEMAQQRAIDTVSPEMKRDWMRTAAYIGQVINSISKTYDEASVDAELKKLQQKVEELNQTSEEGATQT